MLGFLRKIGVVVVFVVFAGIASLGFTASLLCFRICTPSPSLLFLLQADQTACRAAARAFSSLSIVSHWCGRRLAQFGALLRSAIMPRYYCDYCDTHLTHDSPSVRKQHCAGYKHKANVRQYYQQFEEQQTQSLIDQKVKEHLGQTTAAALAQQQVGGAVYSHLATLGGQYKPIAAPGLLRPPALATVRPPVLPPPSGPSGYGSGAPPTYRPPVALPPGGGPTQYYSNNGPSQLQYSNSNGAPQVQYSVSNSSAPPSYSSSSSGGQSQYMSSTNGAPAQYQASGGGSQEQQYSNGPTRVPLPSTYNQGPVYQR